MKEKALRGTKFRQKLKLFGSDKLDKRGRNQMLDSQHARQFVGSVHLWLVAVRARRSFSALRKLVLLAQVVLFKCGALTNFRLEPTFECILVCARACVSSDVRV